MLSGFNTNYRHRGVLFHVQTEDSGRGHPHVITHLFHGGNILASEKREYADLLSDPNVGDGIRKLMEGQHKAMLKRLSRGEYDSLLAERLGVGVFGSGTDASATGTTDPSPASKGAEPTRVIPEPTGSGLPLSRVFGDRVVSEKPLDEVVLDYLVENARKRKRSGR